MAKFIRAFAVAGLGLEILMLGLLALTILGNLPITDGTPTQALLNSYGPASLVAGFWFLLLGATVTFATVAALGLFVSGDLVDFPSRLVAVAGALQGWWLWAATHLSASQFFVPGRPIPFILLVSITVLSAWQICQLVRHGHKPRLAN